MIYVFRKPIKILNSVISVVVMKRSDYNTKVKEGENGSILILLNDVTLHVKVRLF